MIDRGSLTVLVVVAACAHPAPAAPPMPTSEAQCLALVGRTAPVESCTATPLAHGRALWIAVTTSCWEDACETDDLLIVGDRAPMPLPGDGGGVVVVDPSLHFALHEQVAMERPGQWEIYLARVDLETGEQARFADCMAPALSPGGRWFVCRDAGGDAYRIPVGGGTRERIFQLDLGDGDAVDWAPMRWGRPAPATFPTPSTIVLPTTVRTGDGDFEDRVDRAPWHE